MDLEQNFLCIFPHYITTHREINPDMSSQRILGRQTLGSLCSFKGPKKLHENQWAPFLDKVRGFYFSDYVTPTKMCAFYYHFCVAFRNQAMF